MVSGQVCDGFRWIGQSFAHCDGCGWPYWDHGFDMQVRKDAGPFDPDALVAVPITDAQAESCRRKWGEV